MLRHTHLRMLTTLRVTVPLTILAALSAAAPAHAAELFGGVYKHAVHSPFSLEGGRERGFDLQLGFRGGRLFPRLGLQPYAFGAFNTAGDTSYAAAGLSWRFGKTVYVRPGLGLAMRMPRVLLYLQSTSRRRAAATPPRVVRSALGPPQPGHLVQPPEPRHRQRRRAGQFALLKCGFCASAPQHRLGLDHPVEGRLVDQSQLNPRLLQRQPLLVGVLGDLRGIVIADFGRQRGDQHQ